MWKKVLITIGIIFLTIIIAGITVVCWYNMQIKKVNNISEEKIIEILPGTSTANIVDILKENNIIKSSLATKIYIKLNNVNNLQAGKYGFLGEKNIIDVISTIQNGKILDETVKITFKEGKNIRYIASTIANNTNNTTADVYNLLKDENYISSLIEKYWFLTDKVKNDAIYYPLEGYLYPDTYSFENKDVSIKKIFEAMLEKTGKILNKYRDMNVEKDGAGADIEKNKYTAHEVLTIASIVELEGNTYEDRTKIARVIYNRINKNMSLGSDVTTYYSIKVDMGERELYSKEINTYNAYNTRGPNMNGKLPIGPISNPSEDSIKAVLNPAKNENLYFVADKNGDMYFSNTYEQHQEIINKLKNRGLWYEY